MQVFLRPFIGHGDLFQSNWHWECLWAPAKWSPVARWPSILCCIFNKRLLWAWDGCIFAQAACSNAGVLPLSSLPCSLPFSYSSSTHALLSFLRKLGLGHTTAHAVSQADPLWSITGPSLSLTGVSHPSRHQLLLWPDHKFFSILVPVFHPIIPTGPHRNPCTSSTKWVFYLQYWCEVSFENRYVSK